MKLGKIIAFIVILVALTILGVVDYYLILYPIIDSDAIGQLSAGVYWSLSLPVSLGITVFMLLVCWVCYSIITTPAPEPISIEDITPVDLDSSPSEESDETSDS